MFLVLWRTSPKGLLVNIRLVKKLLLFYVVLVAHGYAIGVLISFEVVKRKVHCTEPLAGPDSGTLTYLQPPPSPSYLGMFSNKIRKLGPLGWPYRPRQKSGPDRKQYNFNSMVGMSNIVGCSYKLWVNQVDTYYIVHMQYTYSSSRRSPSPALAGFVL